MSIFRRFFGVLTIAFCCVFAIHSAWANFYITTTTGYYQHAPTVCIKAKGSFFIDWGDGGTDSCHNSIVKNCCKFHTYSDNSIPHTVEISGQPTEYADYTNATFYAQPTIAFCNWGNPYSFHCVAPWVAGISGSIGEIFPTLGNGNNPGQQPSFNHTFGSMPNLTGSIPANLFNGVHGNPVPRMFSNLFYADTGLTGMIPSDLFSGITGTAVGAFAYAFAKTTHLSCHVPAALFHNIIGTVPQSMFYETFSGSPENGPDDGFCTESGTYGWIAPDAFSISRLYGTPFSNYQMYRMFYKSGLAQSCPSGYTQWVTGFEDDWDGRKACVPSSMTLTVNCGEGTGSGSTHTVHYNDVMTAQSPSSWGCTAPAGETFSYWAVSNSTDTYNAGQQFHWHYVQNKVFTAVWEGHYYNFALNHKDGSNNVNTVYEKYNAGWATSANASSWNSNMILPQDTVRDGYTLRGYYDYDVGDVSSNDTVSETEAYYHMKIKYDSSSSGWKLPAPIQAPGATWYAAWARNCAPVAPATCSLQIAPHTGSVTYVTTCPEGYNKVNGTSYNPSCTPTGVTITLNNNDATSAGSEALRTRYGVGVYLDPDATMQMTTNSNPITKPQKQFTVNYNAQGGTTANLTNSNKTATFTFGGYFDKYDTLMIGSNGYIKDDGITAGTGYTNDKTWTARWSGGTVTLPNASRPGYTLAGWRMAGNCGGALVGTPGQSYTPSGNVTLYACWTNVPYYTITLSDGPYNDITQHGYISSTGSSQCTTAGMKYGDGWLNICNATPQVGDTLSLRQVPKRTNYVFAGYWAELAGGASGVDKMVVEPDGDFVTTSEVLVGFTSDSAIGAHWAPKYLITLNPNGGSGGDASVYEGYGIGWSKTQNGDYTETSITPPTRTGYTFTGFWSDPNAGVRYIRSNGTLPDPDSFNSARTLYAHWVPKTYTITLNDNGGSGGLVGDADANCNTAGLQYGTAWVNICGSSSSGGTVSDRGATGDRGSTSDGESGKAEGASGESGGSEKTTAASSTGLSLYHIPERNGYGFNGYWTATSGGDMIVTPNGNFLGGDALTFTSQDRQIYAHWISWTPSNTIYTITLDPNNNGADGGLPPKIYQKGPGFWADSAATTYQITGSVFDPIADGGAGITRPTPPSGKAFSGYWWDRMTEQFTDAEGIITHVPDFTANITVTAHWVNAATTTVTLNPNGGKACAVTSVTATQGQPMPNLTCAPNPPTGYDFTGYWNTQHGGYPQYYDSDLNSAFIWNQTGSSATIYAGYTPAERYITYQCGGTSFGSVSLAQVATYGDSYTIASMSDVGCNTVSGKKFIGWTDAGTGTFFEPGHMYLNWPYYTDMTLVATYLDVYTVTLAHPNATNNPSPTVVYIVPYTSNSNGHEGWYSDSTGDTQITHMQTKPERPFYAFAGYTYQGAGETSGNTIDIIYPDGYFVYDADVLRKITASGTANASWTPLAPEFSVVTTSLSANTTFKFYIGAAGSFMVNWGDGNTQVVSSPGVVSHTYSSANTYTIGISGDATGYTGTYRTGTIYNTAQVVESTQWSNNDVRPTQLNFPAAIRFGCEAGDSSCTLTPQLISAVHGSLGDVFPTLGTGNTQQPRFSRTFAGCTNLTDVPENLFGGVYGSAIPGMFYGTFEDSGLVSVGQNLFSGITSFAPHVFQRTFMGSNLANASMYLFGRIAGAPAEAMFAYTFANTKLSGIPSDMFGGVAGTPAKDMFWGTFSGVSTLSGSIPSGLFGGMSGAPAKGMFDSTFYECYNLTGTIPANLFGGTGLLGAPAERMFAGTFYGCYYLTGTIPANLFGGTNLSGVSAVEMFDTTFYACGSLSGYVPMTLFGGISTSNPATNMMNHVFQYSGVWSSCPCGTQNYTTGFESYWDSRVSCQIGLKPNEHWYGNICVEDCAAGITQIKTSTGLSFQILKTKPTDHAIYVSAPNDGTVCYVPLDSGAASGSINVSLNGSAYHTGSVSSTAPSGWDPLTWY